MFESVKPGKKKSAQKLGTKKRGGLVRRAATGALLAASLAAAPPEADDAITDPPGKGRLFSVRVLDRLEAPLTRYHE